MPHKRHLLVLLPALALSFVFSLAASGNESPASSAAAVPPRDDTLAYLEGLPETNPYRATLLRLHTLSKADREALTGWINGGSVQDEPVPSLTSEQQALAREFAADLVALSAQPLTHAEDWPILSNPDAPDDPTCMLLPAAGLARDLARLAVKTGDTLPPEQATAIYAATAQLGRHQRAGAALIEQLTGVAIESRAFSAVSRRLSEFSLANLQRLSADWAALHPRPDNAQVLAGEFDLFFTPIVNNFIRPGLAAVLAGNAESGDGPDSWDKEDPDAGFTRDLRLSGLVDLGDGERRISLENTATGLTFMIVEGKSTEDIKLVSLDFENHEAIIRRGSCEAVIHLESKRIVERRRDEHADIERLQRIFNATPGTPTYEAQKKLLEAVVALARSHPGGADGYADDLLKTYRRLMDDLLAAADSADVPANYPAPPDTTDPLIKFIFPALGDVSRSLNNSATSATALQAAIHHRLVQLGAAAPDAAPVDPWAADASPFAYEATPDGGFLLRSRYEVDPDQPLTYKFAAPDAGFVRGK